MMGKDGFLVNIAALLVGFLGFLVLKVGIYGAVKKKGDFRFWFSSDAWRVSLCFSSLHITAILWNYIQASLGLLLLSCHNYTLIVGKVGYFVYLAEPLVGYLGG